MGRSSNLIYGVIRTKETSVGNVSCLVSETLTGRSSDVGERRGEGRGGRISIMKSTLTLKLPPLLK